MSVTEHDTGNAVVYTCITQVQLHPYSLYVLFKWKFTIAMWFARYLHVSAHILCISLLIIYLW